MERSSEADMKVAYRTDRGKKRTINQDAILADGAAGLFLLADGIGGGHRAGEIASSLAVEEAYSYLKGRIGRNMDKADIAVLLSGAIHHAHNLLIEKSRSDRRLEGMGTTLLIMFIKDRTAYICHVGDSRAYTVRRRIRQLTEDHTFQSYLDSNIMIRDLFFKKKAKTLMQAVGISRDLSPESTCVEIKSGAVVLLCTDGLTDMLEDNEIIEIMHNRKFEPDECAEGLLAEANKKGGNDNISVILVSVSDQH